MPFATAVANPDSSPARIGYIGLGLMGMPMCRHLLRAGHSLMVFNRSRARSETLGSEGARVASSVAELAAHADIIFTCLDSHAASESVYLGDDGLIQHARRGTILVEHSTITSALAARIGERAASSGLSFLDAPVSGGPEGATKGTLAIMIGGDAAAVERIRHLLGTYGSTIRRMGDVGSGTRAKLVNQLLTFMHGAVAAEAIALASTSGLDLGELSEILQNGFGQSRMFERTLARVQHGAYEAGAMLAHYEKDLGAVAALGEELGIALPVLTAAQGFVRASIHTGHGAQDLAALRLMYPESTPSASKP